MPNLTQNKSDALLTAMRNLEEETRRLIDMVKKLETDDVSEKTQTKNTLATELSNILFNVFVLAEHYGINLEESFLETVNNYVLKFI
ncbi:MAG: MazG nucleotide pyrophosphohydrolase domain-containing protein [Candidatus Bathyarchaeales archaeon]